jgi:serine protease Do
MPLTRAAPLSALLACLVLVCPSLARAADASPSPASSLTPQAAHDLLHALDDASVSVFEKVAPAVVIIEADKKPSSDEQDQSFDFYYHSPEGGEGTRPHMPEPPVRSEGSGFIVRPDGYIYTNAHVIEDSDKIEVKLRDGRHFTARLIGTDERTDIAVIKIAAKDLPVVTLLDSGAVRVGQMCFAIGIPYNLDYSFCRGIVSGKGRGNLTSSPTHPMYEDYIQTDAFINPGNSGGPLFDIDGRVMGMNTLINGLGRGLSFAIPSNMLNDVGTELIATGKVVHPWLGITVRGLAEALDDETPASQRFHGIDQGVCVETIEADTPAYKSDLRPLDVITRVDGVPVLTAHDLQREILRKKVAQSVALSVWRGGKTFDIAVTTEALPDDLTKVSQAHSRARTRSSENTRWGLEFGPQKASQASGDKPPGAIIATVADDSPASRARLRPGDIITSVDDKPVSDAVTCFVLLGASRNAAGPVVQFTRSGAQLSATLDTGAADKQ